MVNSVDKTCEVIQQIVEFARDNNNTINDAVIDSFFSDPLSRQDKRVIRSFLSRNGVEILVNEGPAKLEISSINPEDISFEDSVSYGRGGEVDGFKQLLRSLRQYPLLSAQDEIRCSVAWQKAMAADKILAVMKDENASAATTEMIRKAFPKHGSPEDFADYYLPLDGKEACDLKSIYEKGLEERNLLVNSNVRLSIAYAKKLSSGVTSDFEDLYMYGVEGVMRACDKYDYRKGFRFSTYATFWIRQFQSRLKNDQMHIVRIPAHLNEKIAKMKNVTEKLLKKLGRDPLPEEVAKAMGITVQKMEELSLSMKEVLSTDYLIDHEDNDESISLEHYLVADEKNSPESVAESRAFSRSIAESLSSLPEREAQVISLHYGIGGDAAMTMEQISESIGVSKERVRQIELRGLKRLKSPLHKKKLREYTEFAV